MAIRVLHSFFLNALPLHTKEYSFTSVTQCIHVGSTTLTSLLSTATGKVLRVVPEGQLQYCSGGRWGGDGGVVACCNRIPSQRIVEVLHPIKFAVSEFTPVFSNLHPV